jgi:hypothetical protein
MGSDHFEDLDIGRRIEYGNKIKWNRGKQCMKT